MMGTDGVNMGRRWLSYYKCTCVGCNVRKWVEQSPAREMPKIKYEGKHNHEMPNKLAKEISDSQYLAGNMNILSHNWKQKVTVRRKVLQKQEVNSDTQKSIP